MTNLPNTETYPNTSAKIQANIIWICEKFFDRWLTYSESCPNYEFGMVVGIDKEGGIGLEEACEEEAVLAHCPRKAEVMISLEAWEDKGPEDLAERFIDLLNDEIELTGLSSERLKALAE